MALLLTDQTANGNDLTNNGATEQTASLPYATNNTRTASLVAASSQELHAATSSSLQFTGDFTLEANIYINIKDKTNPIVVRDSNTSRCWKLQITSANMINVIFWNSSGQSSDFVGSTALTTGQWYHVAAACTVATPTAIIVLNGSSETVTPNATNATSVNAGDATCYIGLNERTGGYADLLIDDIRVYNVARTLAEIQSDDNQEPIINAPNAVALWPFETAASAAAGPANLKTHNGIAKASIKTHNGIAIASWKTRNGII